MGKSIKCICINDKDKPTVIPKKDWIVSGERYSISHIFIMQNQGGIQGCELAERDISQYKPFNCFKLSRFAIALEDMEKLMQMIRDCDELNQLEEVDIQKWVEEVTIKETVL